MATLDETFTNIANAIRTKSGTSTKLTPANMPQAITNLPNGPITIPNFNFSSENWINMPMAEPDAFPNAHIIMNFVYIDIITDNWKSIMQLGSVDWDSDPYYHFTLDLESLNTQPNASLWIHSQYIFAEQSDQIYAQAQIKSANLKIQDKTTEESLQCINIIDNKNTILGGNSTVELDKNLIVELPLNIRQQMVNFIEDHIQNGIVFVVEWIVEPVI